MNRDRIGFVATLADIDRSFERSDSSLVGVDHLVSPGDLVTVVANPVRQLVCRFI